MPTGQEDIICDAGTGLRVQASDGGRTCDAEAGFPWQEDVRLGDMEEGQTAEAPQMQHTLSSRCHPVATNLEVTSSIRLLNARHFEALQRPLPRCQDLPADVFGVPTHEDFVVAVSHGWRNQTHPDPLGTKAVALTELLGNLGNASDQEVYVFFDFLSVPQRPFRRGQADRTKHDTQTFESALECMHHMYFLSDRIVHLEFESEEVEGELEEYMLPAHELHSAVILQVGDWLQITGDREANGDDSRASASNSDASTPTTTRCLWNLFDRIIAVGEIEAPSMEQLQSALDKGDTWVKCIRYPFGKINDIPSDDRGWVFLERFVTAIKCAMLDKEQAKQVVVTRSPTIKAQILAYADRLRTAADNDSHAGQAGRQQSALKHELALFLDELAIKRFSGASTDKLMMESINSIDAKVRLATHPYFWGCIGCRRDHRSAATNPDAAIVKGIMEEFIQHLGTHWGVEAAKQQRRADRLAQIVADYFYAWLCFDEAPSAHLVFAWIL